MGDKILTVHASLDYNYDDSSHKKQYVRT